MTVSDKPITANKGLDKQRHDNCVKIDIVIPINPRVPAIIAKYIQKKQRKLYPLIATCSDSKAGTIDTKLKVIAVKYMQID